MPPELILETNARGHSSGLSGKGEELARYLARERGFDLVGSRSMCVFCRRGEHELPPKNARKDARVRILSDRRSDIAFRFFLLSLLTLLLLLFSWALIRSF